MKPSLEHQFLPAVLELQDTPPSPLGRAIIWLVVFFFIIALIWAYLGRIDIVAIAVGKIIPNGHVKVIQPLQIGTVTAIHVKEGQKVRKGDSLIELDAININAEITQLVAEYSFAEQQIKRLEWLAGQQNNDSGVPTYGGDLVLRSQWQEYQDRLNTLQAERSKRKAEYAAIKQQEKNLPVYCQ